MKPKVIDGQLSIFDQPAIRWWEQPPMERCFHYLSTVFGADRSILPELRRAFADLPNMDAWEEGKRIALRRSR